MDIEFKYSIGHLIPVCYLFIIWNLPKFILLSPSQDVGVNPIENVTSVNNSIDNPKCTEKSSEALRAKLL